MTLAELIEMTEREGLDPARFDLAVWADTEDGPDLFPVIGADWHIEYDKAGEHIYLAIHSEALNHG